jgi:hypothetical protein
MGFKVLSELPGSDNRLDLCLELKAGTYIIIELKYCPYVNKLTEDEKNMALAKDAMTILTEPIVKKVLAQAVKAKLNAIEVIKVISKAGFSAPSEQDANQALANEALEHLTDTEINQVLADTVKNKLTAGEIRAIYKTASPQGNVSDVEIEDILIKAAQRALADIRDKNYHSIAMNTADGIKEIIDLGLSIYGHGSHIKAAFSL